MKVSKVKEISKKFGYLPQEIQILTKEASDREYFRLIFDKPRYKKVQDEIWNWEYHSKHYKDDKHSASLIFCYINPELGSNKRFVELSNHISEQDQFAGMVFPKIYAFDDSLGVTIQQDCFETILACAIADWVCRLFHGTVLELPISLEGFRDWQELPTFALVGLCTGIVCLLFQTFLLFIAKRFQKFHHHPNKLIFITGLWGCLLGVILLVKPEVLGIGHTIFEDAIQNSLPFIPAILILATRIPLSAISYATGAPGGLIVPALLFGVLSGQAFSTSYAFIVGGVDADFHSVCLVAGMAASIGALFRTPLTATIMAVEITGAYDCVLEISIAYLAAHSLLGLARQPDLYTALGRIHESHTGKQVARIDAARSSIH